MTSDIRIFQLLALAFVALLTACSSANPPVVEAFLTRDGRIVAEPGSIREGETIIKIQNDDDQRHRPILARINRSLDRLPVRGSTVPVGDESEVDFEGEGYLVLAKVDRMKPYFTGPQRVIETIHDYLEPGRYILFCNLPGHYERGEFVEIRVSRAG